MCEPIGASQLFFGFAISLRLLEVPPFRLRSDEHIVPYSLWGNKILADASCRECADVTSRFEGAVSQVQFGLLRTISRMPTRHRKKRQQELPLEIEQNGVRRILMVPVDDYISTGFQFPEYSEPTILSKQPDVIGNWPEIRLTDVRRPTIPDASQRRKRVEMLAGGPFRAIITLTTPIYEFGLLLAKVAYTAALDHFGPNSFKPLLQRTLRMRTLDCSRFVGCTPYPKTPTPEYIYKHAPGVRTPLHVYYFAVVQVPYEDALGRTFEVAEYLAAIVWPFIGMNPPTYIVVVGEASPYIIHRLAENQALFIMN